MTAKGHDVVDLGDELRCTRCGQILTTGDRSFGWFASQSDERKVEIMGWVNGRCPADGPRTGLVAETGRDCRP